MPAKLEIEFRGKKQKFFEPLRARIILGDHTSKNDDHYLSADCATFDELKEEVDYLKAQLDKILKRAQSKFAKQDQ